MNSLIGNPGLSHIFTKVLNFLDTKNQLSCRLGEFTTSEYQISHLFYNFLKKKIYYDHDFTSTIMKLFMIGGKYKTSD